MVSKSHDLPEWLIDDTSHLRHGRVFVVHTYVPRFVGELVLNSKAVGADLKDFIIAMPFGRTLCRIDWIDSVQALPSEEFRRIASKWSETLAEAFSRHVAIRSVWQ